MADVLGGVARAVRVVGQAIRLPSLADREAGRGERRWAAGRRIACPTTLATRATEARCR